MNCPNCHHGLQTDRTYADFACANCGLAGPRELLEKLSRKLAFTAHVELEDRIVDLEQQLEAERDRRIEAERPAAVLAEAEKLLDTAHVIELVTLPSRRRLKRSLDPRDYYGATLAEAYERLRGGRHG